MPSILTLLSLLSTAHAFCGTFVASDGDMTNGASQVALVRQGQTTTLTMANDFDGPADDFAMVIPVPRILDEEDVHVVDPAVFLRLGLYSEPRMVTYTCEDLYPEEPRGGGCGPVDPSDESVDFDVEDAETGSDGVTVEKQFIVGEYEIVVLSAEESSGLLSWLNANGYAVSEEAEALLQEYLEAGSYFFAAKVFSSRIPSGQIGLSPLQFSYDSPAFSLPIRLGTVNSPGSQDLLIYAITELGDGSVAISNYPEATVEADCLLDTEDLQGTYAGLFAESVAGDEASWVVEYSWSLDQGSLHCDPCTSVPGLPQDDIATLGFETGGADTGWWSWAEYHFTRIHMRYTPEQAHQDLALYTTGSNAQRQQRYIAHASYLEAEFPLCGQGWVEDPGSCADESRVYKQRMRGEETPNPNGCAVNSDAGTRGAFALLALAGAFLLRRRGGAR